MKKETEPWHREFEDAEKKLRQWRRDNPKVTLTEIENKIDAELGQIRERIVRDMAQEGEAASEKERYECPKCGGTMVKNGRKKRALKSKEGQKVILEREQQRCLECRTTIFPPG